MDAQQLQQQVAALTQQVQNLIQAHEQLREASRATTLALEQRLAATDAALAASIAQSTSHGFPGNMQDLKPFVDFKTMTPDKFSGGTPEQFQAWSRSVKNYLEAKMRGMRLILDKVETEEAELRGVGGSEEG